MLLKILTFPDPNLRKVAKAVTDFDDALKKTIADMLETMYHANGIGLAATQVNIHKRLIVIDVSDERNQPLVIINPKFAVVDANLQDYKEGCLSVPEFYEEISRPTKIKLEFQDADGNRQFIEPAGLLSVCIQHEIDHLNGKLFVDHISSLKRERIRKQLLKRSK